MRIGSIVLSMFLLSTCLFAQERLLVDPLGRTTPLKGKESARTTMEAKLHRTTSSDCPSTYTFGYDMNNYPLQGNGFNAWHKEVFGEWFTAPAAGTIDTIFWYIDGSIGALDSLILIRVHRSVIGPNYGPGVRPGIFNPPCQNWGYWVNTNDADQGIAAFIEQATDTTWISTYKTHDPGPQPQTRPPFAEELWGGPGFPVSLRPEQVNFAVMADLEFLHVNKGDLFFLSLTVNSANIPEPVGDRATVFYSYFENNVSPTDPRPIYPSHNWKFYEHAHGPSNCAGWTSADIDKGWVARGGGTQDTLSIAVYNIWYSMHVEGTAPPSITELSVVHNTTDTGPQTIDATIMPCYPAHPESAGLASAMIRWKINGIEQSPIPMSNVGGDTYEGQIPGQPGGGYVSYFVDALNLQGIRSYSANLQYRIVSTRTEWYMIDQAYACTSHDIRATGTAVDTASLFTTPFSGHGTATGDDGTSGPYDLGKKFVFFGDTVRWAWIGVNGAMAVSKTADDTIDANSNGYYSTSWTIPYPIYHHRADTVRGPQTNSYMPPNAILPFWNDLLYRLDSPRTRFGRILYGDRGDSCLFIVEWDSLGIFQTSGTVISDISRFRVVLNKCDGTITFEYDHVGVHGLDSTALVGIQGDSTDISGPTPGYIFVNQNTYPIETKPADGRCIHFVPAVGFYALDGWNMVSAAVNAYGGNYSKAYLFPRAVSPAFAYQNGYKQADPLTNGPGYWMKFSGAQYVGALGTFKTSLSTPVADKWNIIGSISLPLPTAALFTVPPGIISSSIFGYRSDSGYTVTSHIMPGHAYWVKTSGGGTLDMSASAIVPKTIPVETELAQANRLTIVDARGRRQDLYLAQEGTLSRPASMFELPPPAPDGGIDARFASERMLESYPAKLDEGKSCEYTVSVNSAVYPLSVRWDIKSKLTGHSFVLSDVAGGKVLGNTILSGRGQVKIANASVKKFSIRLASGVTLPREFALSQNYPNPFNPVTRFEVAIPKLATVDIVVYDVLGRRITTLLSGMQPAGYMTLEWNGRDSHNLNAPTGIYFVRMTSDAFSAVRKIMLMK